MNVADADEDGWPPRPQQLPPRFATSSRPTSLFGPPPFLYYAGNFFITVKLVILAPPPFPLHQFYHRRKCKRAPQPHTLLLFFFPFNASSFSNAKSIESKKDDILKFGRGTVRSGPLFFLVRLRSFLSRIWEWPMFIRIVKGSPPFLIPIFSSFGIRAQRTRNFFSGSTDEFGFCGEAARHRSGLLCVSAPPSCRLSVMDGPTLIARHGPTWPAGGSVTGRRVATVNSRSCCWHTRLPSVFRFCFFVFFWGGGGLLEFRVGQGHVHELNRVLMSRAE